MSQNEINQEIYKSFIQSEGIEKFLGEIERFGIRNDDQRVESLKRSLKEDRRSQNEDTIDINTFAELVRPYKNLLTRYSKRDFVIPDFESFSKTFVKIYEKCKLNTSGNNANYIPQLANVSDYWGVSVCSVDGQRFSIGDTQVPFMIQSCSKPLSYAVALEHLSADVVHKYIGQEASGRIFNEMILDYNGKPHNPMINSGAIATSALLHTLVKKEMNVDEKLEYLKSWIERAAGGAKFGYQRSSFLSEKENADRNFALTYFMREHKVFPDNEKALESLDLYLQTCSLETTAEHLATVAATLANGGICPTTEETVFNHDTVRDVLSLMHSCGLYDYSGQFSFKVGLPAKSGVAHLAESVESMDEVSWKKFYGRKFHG